MNSTLNNGVREMLNNGVREILRNAIMISEQMPEEAESQKSLMKVFSKRSYLSESLIKDIKEFINE